MNNSFDCDPYGPPSAYTCPAGCTPYTATRLEEFVCTDETRVMACTPEDTGALVGGFVQCFQSLEDPEVFVYSNTSFLMLADEGDLLARYWRPCPEGTRVSCGD